MFGLALLGARRVEAVLLTSTRQALRHTMPLIILSVLTFINMLDCHPVTIDVTTYDSIQSGCPSPPFCYYSDVTGDSNSCGVICGGKGSRVPKCLMEENCRGIDGVWVPVGDWLPCNATCQSQLNVDAQGNRFYLGHAHRSQRCQDRTGGHVRIDLGGIPCNGDAVEVRNCSILAKPCDELELERQVKIVGIACTVIVAFAVVLVFAAYVKRTNIRRCCRTTFTHGHIDEESQPVQEKTDGPHAVAEVGGEDAQVGVADGDARGDVQDEEVCLLEGAGATAVTPNPTGTRVHPS